MQIVQSEKFYSTSELAQLCHVDPSTIFRAIANKTIHATTTPGGHYRISREEAKKFLKKNNILLHDAPPRTIRVLVVDDNPLELRMLKRGLGKDKEFEVATALSGYEAGLVTHSFNPDVVMLDIFLKDLDGREVARLIRQDKNLDHIKIVAVTGAKDPKDIKDILASSFDSVFFKPLDLDTVRSKLKRLVS